MENGNNCAFPADSKTQTDGGLTKREYFAGLAMQGILSNPDWAKSMNISNDWDDYKERVAKGSVEIADELLKHLTTHQSEG